MKRNFHFRLVALPLLLAASPSLAVSWRGSKPVARPPLTPLWTLRLAPSLPAPGGLKVQGSLPLIERPRALEADLGHGIDPLPQAKSFSRSGQASERPSREALESLESAQEGIERSPQDGGKAQALRRLYEGASPSGSSPVPAASEGDSFVLLAKSLFYPTLAPGQEAGVAAARASLPEGVASDEEVRSEVGISPLSNPEREEAVRKLFLQAGAGPEEILLQDAGEGRHNIVVVKKGSRKAGFIPSLRRFAYRMINWAYQRMAEPVGLPQRFFGPERVVVVGAHHDKVSVGAGTIDNWTGTTMMINLYQAIRGLETETSFVFAAFAREEEGLLGSQAFLDSLSEEERSRIDSMVNLDTLAVDGTYSWKNNSTRALLDLIRAVAAREKFDLSETALWGGDADSSSFRRAGIAAMTVFGASPDLIFDIIHSEKDTVAYFSLPHYRNAYGLVLALLRVLDRDGVRREAPSE